MANNTVNVTKSSPRDYDDNKPRDEVQDYTIPSREFRPVPETTDWKLTSATWGAPVVALVVFAIVYAIWKWRYCAGFDRFATCDSISNWEPRVIGAGVIGFLLLRAWAYTTEQRARVAQQWAIANRTNLTLTRFGNAEPADYADRIFSRQSLLDALIFGREDRREMLRMFMESRYALDVELKKETHPSEIYGSVNNLNITEAAGAPNISTNINPLLTDEEMIEADDLIPDSEWMRWIDQTPHLLLSARTNAGKTTLAMAILAARAGEPLLILDPHDQPDKWFGLRAIGGGRDFEAILVALAGVLEEMDRRYEEYDRGKKTEHFERLTVLIDETPALVAHTMDGQRTIDPRWKKFAKQLGSEARKVRISAILLTQSPLVQDIQISTYMRENFTRIALGDQIGKLLSEEKEPRRSDLVELLRGREYAAAMEYKNEIHVLNTDNVPMLAQRPRGAPRMWTPPVAYQPVTAAHSRPSDTARTSFTPADLLAVPASDGRTADKERTRLYLKAMAGAGKTRDYARERMAQLNMPFENKLWTEVRKELGMD